MANPIHNNNNNNNNNHCSKTIQHSSSSRHTQQQPAYVAQQQQQQAYTAQQQVYTQQQQQAYTQQQPAYTQPATTTTPQPASPLTTAKAVPQESGMNLASMIAAKVAMRKQVSTESPGFGEEGGIVRSYILSSGSRWGHDIWCWIKFSCTSLPSCNVCELVILDCGCCSCSLQIRPQCFKKISKLCYLLPNQNVSSSDELILYFPMYQEFNAVVGYNVQ